MLKIVKTLLGFGTPPTKGSVSPQSLGTASAQPMPQSSAPPATQSQTISQPVSQAPAPAASVPAPPKVSIPTQAPQKATPTGRPPTADFLEGEAVRATDEWRARLEDGPQLWEAKMQQLMERLQALQKDGGGDSVMLLLMLASYYHLPFTPETVLESNFPQAIQQRIERDLAITKYKALMVDKTKTRWNSYPRSVDYYVEEFVILRTCFLDGFLNLVDTLPEVIQVVEDLHPQVEAEEQKHKPEFGGDNLLRFRGVLSRIAREQLPSVRSHDFFPEPVPRYMRDAFSSDIETSGGLLLWAISAAIKAFSPSRTTPSTSQVGIEFEQRLMGEIMEAFPNAQIEPTPVTGDQGADVLVTIDGIKLAIQAKRYTGVVGNAAVQEIFAAQQFYGADYALVVTTSRYTAPAQALAQKINVELTTADDYLRRIKQLLV